MGGNRGRSSRRSCTTRGIAHCCASNTGKITREGDCGAIRHRDEAERELRKLGKHVQRTLRGKSEGVGLESLTKRELQVARLVVERKTNPEIAAELFFSSKTIETHLRHIFGN